jgi:hypothetical protein
MMNKRIHRLLLVAGVAFALLAAFGLVNEHSTSSSADHVLDLQVPPFVNVARAETVSATSVIAEEAGIAAYTQAPWAIDLSAVRGEFRTIERETAEYIIGSVGIPDYSEDHDPHVYVHTDGWVLAYYLATEPASYIMDLRHYDGITIGTTKLEDAMHEILSAIGVVSFEATFYDFRYPNATNMMLIAEAIYSGGYNYEGDESFNVYLPIEFTYYDRSWSHAQHSECLGVSTLYVDEASVSSLSGGCPGGWKLAYEGLTTAQLPPGVSHTIRINLDKYEDQDVDAFAGIALVYREVP